MKIKTNLGSFSLELDEENAPVSSKNFKDYVEKSFFNMTIFHRVIDGFMIQGGGFTLDMTQKETHTPIKNEASNGLKNEKYTISMARTSDPNSATSQFFINLVDNGFLNYSGKSSSKIGYCVFGSVIEGKDIVDKIGKLKTQTKNGQGDVPIKKVVIKSIKQR